MTTLLTIISIVLDSLNMALLVNILLKLTNKENIDNNLNKIFISFLFVVFAFTSNNLITIYLPSLLWIKSILFILVTAISTTFIYKLSIFKCFFATLLTSVVTAFLNIILALVLKFFRFNARKIYFYRIKFSYKYYYNWRIPSLSIVKINIQIQEKQNVFFS